MSKSILSILTEIQQTSATLGKKAILEQHKSNEDLKKVLQMTLDPSIVSGMKKLPEAVQNDVNLDLSAALDTLENNIYNRRFTGNAGRDFVANVFGSVSDDDREVLKRVLTKDLSCGIQEKNVNDVFGKGFIKDEPYMRCSLLNEKTIKKIALKKYGYFYSDMKMDGAYLAHEIVNGTSISTSRNGKMYDFLGTKDSALADIANELARVSPDYANGVVLTGEALCLDGDGNILPRTTSNGIISKAGKGTINHLEAESVIFVVWDAIPVEKYHDRKWNKDLHTRRPFLEQAIKNVSSPIVRMVEYRTVHSLQEAFAYNTELMERGEEGTIIKSPDNIWQSHTSPTCLKVKLKMEVDLVCVGVEEGAGKRRNTTGALQLESACGVLKCNVGTGFTEKQLDEIWKVRDTMLGKVITVSVNDIVYDKRTNEPSLFLIVFVEIRNDKNTADTFDRILEIRESAVEVFSKHIMDTLV